MVSCAMDEIGDALAKLHEIGWTSAAIADELEVSPVTVLRWQKGERNPDNLKSVLYMLDSLSRKKRIPKRKRRGESSPSRNLGT
jgi:transcriptional regulator with XRE-family HTH domain